MDVQETANHLANVHYRNRQDGLIFVGSRGHRGLLEKPQELAPTIFTTEIPIFVADEFLDAIQLRWSSQGI